MKSKYGHQSKTVGDQVRDPKRPSLSLNGNTRSQREYFPGHRLQVRISPSKNFGTPRNQGNFLGKSRAWRNPPDKSGIKGQPGDKSRDRQEYWAEENLSSSRGNCQWDKIPRRVPANFGTPSHDVRDIEPRKDPLERIPQVNVQIRHSWEAIKSKHPRCYLSLSLSISLTGLYAPQAYS